MRFILLFLMIRLNQGSTRTDSLCPDTTRYRSERVDRLAALFNPKKTTYADVTYVDVAIPAGAAREGTVNPDLLALIRNADALLNVARAFDDPASPRSDEHTSELQSLMRTSYAVFCMIKHTIMYHNYQKIY